MKSVPARTRNVGIGSGNRRGRNRTQYAAVAAGAVCPSALASTSASWTNFRSISFQGRDAIDGHLAEVAFLGLHFAAISRASAI